MSGGLNYPQTVVASALFTSDGDLIAGTGCKTAKIGVGVYKVTLDYPAAYREHLPIAICGGSAGFAPVIVNCGFETLDREITVSTFNAAGVPVNAYVNFILFRVGPPFNSVFP